MRFGAILATILGALVALATPASAAPAGGDPAIAAAARLHRGVNVLGYDPLWKDPGKARFTPRHFTVIRQGGFDYVRIVLQAFDRMGPDGTLDPKWFATLDRLVADATAAGLSVILDEHDFNKCSKDVAQCEAKLTAFWRQVAEHYRGAPDTVLFELLNEPHDALNGAPWNRILAKLVPLVRQSNPGRTLVIGPTHWNSMADLPLLELPTADRNIIVTVHYYEPFRFTHQGAPWADEAAKLKDIPLTAADEVRIREDFAKVGAWSRANGRPVLLGEFGAYDGSGIPMADRVRYTRTVREAAEANGMPWAYWQFDGDFIVYDIPRDRWVEPIREALVGSAMPAPAK